MLPSFWSKTLRRDWFESSIEIENKNSPTRAEITLRIYSSEGAVGDERRDKRKAGFWGAQIRQPPDPRSRCLLPVPSFQAWEPGGASYRAGGAVARLPPPRRCGRNVLNTLPQRRGYHRPQAPSHEAHTSLAYLPRSCKATGSRERRGRSGDGLMIQSLSFSSTDGEKRVGRTRPMSPQLSLPTLPFSELPSRKGAWRKRPLLKGFWN